MSEFEKWRVENVFLWFKNVIFDFKRQIIMWQKKNYEH